MVFPVFREGPVSLDFNTAKDLAVFRQIFPSNAQLVNEVKLLVTDFF